MHGHKLRKYFTLFENILVYLVYFVVVCCGQIFCYQVYKSKEMLKIDILATDIPLLKHERYNHPHPHVMRKTNVLYLKSLGFSNKDICKIVGVCDNTIREYFNQYKEGGIERLKEINFYQPISELSEYSGSIEKYLTENPPTSTSQASAMIERITGIKRGKTQVRNFLKTLKLNILLAKALTDEKTSNVSFLEQELCPRIRRSQSKGANSFFADAVHFIMGSFLDYLWCITRIFIPPVIQEGNVITYCVLLIQLRMN